MIVALLLLCFLLNPFTGWLLVPLYIALGYFGGLELITETTSVIFRCLYHEACSLWRIIKRPRKSVSGEIALITGAGSGIGRLLAMEMAQKGAIVVVWDINVQGGEETVKAIQDKGGKAHFFEVNLAEREAIYACADRVKKDVGKVTILVNNAGVVTGNSILEASDAMIDLSFKVNSIAHLWTLKAFLPDMFENNHGHVVTIASSAGLCGIPGLVDYCATKFAAVGIDESLAAEIVKQGKGIKTTVVCPYYIDTGMFQGIKTKFPMVLPVLEQAPVAESIMRAIETNQEILCMPYFIYTVPLLKALFTRQGVLAIGKYFGALDCMDDFKGRAGAEAQK